MTKIARSVKSNAGWTDAHTDRGKYLMPPMPSGRGIKIYYNIFNINVLSAHVP